MNKFYVVSDEDGYQGPFKTYGDANRYAEEQEYGDVVVKIDGVYFSITPYN